MSALVHLILKLTWFKIRQLLTPLDMHGRFHMQLESSQTLNSDDNTTQNFGASKSFPHSILGKVCVMPSKDMSRTQMSSKQTAQAEVWQACHWKILGVPLRGPHWTVHSQR